MRRIHEEKTLHRIVVKLGTNVIMRHDGKVALGLLCGLVEQIAELRAQGIEVLVVSSGAVGLGMERLGLLERPTAVAQIQACAAIGQSRLMSLYDDAFDRLGCPIAQVLLTEDAPSPHHPLGLKGAGEGGINGVGGVIASAIDDALGMLGAVTQLPMSPQRVKELLRKKTRSTSSAPTK